MKNSPPDSPPLFGKAFQQFSKTIEDISFRAEIAYSWVMWNEAQNVFHLFECYRICRANQQPLPDFVIEYFDKFVDVALQKGKLQKSLQLKHTQAFSLYQKDMRNKEIYLRFCQMVEDGESVAKAKKQLLSETDEFGTERRLDQILLKYRELMNR